MEKPDRKKFRREFGPRYAIKYAKAMRQYRKSLKAKPTTPAPGKTKGIGPIKDGAKYARQVANSKTKPTGVGPVKSGAEYARSLQGRSAPAPKSARAPKKEQTAKPKQTTPEQAKARFYSSSSQGSIAKNQEKAKQNFFRSSSGTRGQYRKKGDPGPAVRRRGSVRDGETIDPRERSLRKNLADARRSNRRRLKMNRRGRRTR